MTSWRGLVLIKIVIFVLCAGSWDKIQLRIPATPHTLTVGGHALDKMKTPDYDYIIVESFTPTDTSGRHGLVHIRPIAGQEPFKTTMFVECSKELMNDYPVGTKFKIKAKITNREGGTPFIYSHYSWSYEVIED